MAISRKKPMLCCTSTKTMPIVVSIEMKAATRRMPCTTRSSTCRRRRCAAKRSDTKRVVASPPWPFEESPPGIMSLIPTVVVGALSSDANGQIFNAMERIAIRNDNG